ncbi:hypothetical protein ACFBZI_11265 [Moraxella sp. ZJ142]|uniref:hypothetical protein n=1 Tax=Moraxella marmotae TaxID=3344520 RepID=UPI0035D4E357
MAYNKNSNSQPRYNRNTSYEEARKVAEALGAYRDTDLNFSRLGIPLEAAPAVYQKEAFERDGLILSNGATLSLENLETPYVTDAKHRKETDQRYFMKFDTALYLTEDKQGNQILNRNHNGPKLSYLKHGYNGWNAIESPFGKEHSTWNKADYRLANNLLAESLIKAKGPDGKERNLTTDDLVVRDIKNIPQDAPRKTFIGLDPTVEYSVESCHRALDYISRSPYHQPGAMKQLAMSVKEGQRQRSERTAEAGRERGSSLVEAIRTDQFAQLLESQGVQTQQSNTRNSFGSYLDQKLKVGRPGDNLTNVLEGVFANGTLVVPSLLKQGSSLQNAFMQMEIEGLTKTRTLHSDRELTDKEKTEVQEAAAHTIFNSKDTFVVYRDVEDPNEVTVQAIRAGDKEDSPFNKKFLKAHSQNGKIAVVDEPNDDEPDPKVVFVAESFLDVAVVKSWVKTDKEDPEAPTMAFYGAADAGNLVKVVPKLSERYPNALLVVVADNDNPDPSAETKFSEYANKGVEEAYTAKRETEKLALGENRFPNTVVLIPPGIADPETGVKQKTDIYDMHKALMNYAKGVAVSEQQALLTATDNKRVRVDQEMAFKRINTIYSERSANWIETRVNALIKEGVANGSINPTVAEMAKIQGRAQEGSHLSAGVVAPKTAINPLREFEQANKRSSSRVRHAKPVDASEQALNEQARQSLTQPQTAALGLRLLDKDGPTSILQMRSQQDHASSVIALFAKGVVSKQERETNPHAKLASDLIDAVRDHAISAGKRSLGDAVQGLNDAEAKKLGLQEAAKHNPIVLVANYAYVARGAADAAPAKHQVIKDAFISKSVASFSLSNAVQNSSVKMEEMLHNAAQKDASFNTFMKMGGENKTAVQVLPFMQTMLGESSVASNKMANMAGLLPAHHEALKNIAKNQTAVAVMESKGELGFRSLLSAVHQQQNGDTSEKAQSKENLGYEVASVVALNNLFTGSGSKPGPIDNSLSISINAALDKASSANPAMQEHRDYAKQVLSAVDRVAQEEKKVREAGELGVGKRVDNVKEAYKGTTKDLFERGLVVQSKHSHLAPNYEIVENVDGKTVRVDTKESDVRADMLLSMSPHAEMEKASNRVDLAVCQRVLAHQVVERNQLVYDSADVAMSKLKGVDIGADRSTVRQVNTFSNMFMGVDDKSLKEKYDKEQQMHARQLDDLHQDRDRSAMPANEQREYERAERQVTQADSVGLSR